MYTGIYFWSIIQMWIIDFIDYRLVTDWLFWWQCFGSKYIEFGSESGSADSFGPIWIRILGYAINFENENKN